MPLALGIQMPGAVEWENSTRKVEPHMGDLGLSSLWTCLEVDLGQQPDVRIWTGLV